MFFHPNVGEQWQDNWMTEEKPDNDSVGAGVSELQNEAHRALQLQTPIFIRLCGLIRSNNNKKKKSNSSPRDLLY